MDDDPKNRQATLLPAEQAEEDFKFFRTIENTIIGIFAFGGRYLYTSWAIYFAPRKLVKLISEEFKGHIVARPFTYLGVSALLGGLSLSYLVPVSGSVYGIRQELAGITVLSLFKIAFPVVAVEVLLGLALARILGRGSKQLSRQILELVCYGTGAQLLLISLFNMVTTVMRLGAFWENLIVFSHFLFYLSLFLISLFAIYVYTLPGVLLYVSLRERWRGRSRAYHILVNVGFLVFGILTLNSAAAAAILAMRVDIWKIFGADQPTAPIKCENEKSQFDQEGRFPVTFVVTNASQKTYFLRRDGLALTIEWWGRDKSRGKFSDKIPVNVHSWQASEKSILSLGPGESKWLILDGLLSERIANTIRQTGAAVVSWETLFLPTVRHGEVHCTQFNSGLDFLLPSSPVEDGVLFDVTDQPNDQKQKTQ